MNRPIVVGVTVSPGDTNRAVDWAAAEAARRQAPLRLMHSAGGLLHPLVGASQRVRTELLGLGEDALARAAARASRQAPGVAVEMAIDLDTSPSKTLLAAAAEAELLVLGSHERSALGDILWSSTTAEAIRDAACPVVVVWPHANLAEGDGGADMVVGVDGSATSLRAVQFGFTEASLWKTGLTAVHAWQPPRDGSEPVMYGLLEPAQLRRAEQEHAALLSESIAGCREEYPDVAVREALVKGGPGRTLIDASETARMLVLGTRGHGGIPGMLLGSVSTVVLHHAHCPVMVVPPQ
jgi:nucleotide-binding universal stress UspA family protein